MVLSFRKKLSNRLRANWAVLVYKLDLVNRIRTELFRVNSSPIRTSLTNNDSPIPDFWTRLAQHVDLAATLSGRQSRSSSARREKSKLLSVIPKLAILSLGGAALLPSSSVPAERPARSLGFLRLWIISGLYLLVGCFSSPYFLVGVCCCPVQRVLVYASEEIETMAAESRVGPF